MNRISLSLIIFLLSNSGCTILLTCELFNNTSQNLKVVKFKGSDVESEREFKTNSKIKLEGWELVNYKIFTKNKSWSYKQLRPSSDLISIVGFGPFRSRVFQAQIEKDGRIFVLKVDQSLPASGLTNQPEGFPLIPKIEQI